MDKKLSVLWALCGVILLFPQATSSATCEKTVADIVFLLDDSGSVGRHNFLKVKEFVIGIVRSLRIGSDQVRVATVSFSSNPVINFQLNGYNDKKKLIDAIKNIKYRSGGSTNTHLALEMLNSVFTKGNGDRTGVPNIAIVITDGLSTVEKLTIQKAEALQKAGVVMFSIGIGKNLRQSELIAMASKPTSEHKFTVDNFDALQGITKKITTKTCEEKACYCSGYGDPHYKTFDGQMIHLMGICKYTLAASTKGAPHFFSIEVKNEHRGNTRVSYTRMVDVKLKGVTIRLLPGNKMLVNGEKMSFPIRGVWGFWARYSCGWITVSTSWGLKVQFDGRHRVKVTVRGRFANKLTGICGDCNGKKDDFRTKQGKDVSKNRNKYSLIGSSYKVKDDSGRPTPKCDVPDVKIDCKPHETRRCNVIKHRIFKKCIAKLGMEKVGEYLESCRIDACVYRKNIKLFQKVLCSAIEEYAGECAKAGVPVAWRRVAKCPKRCPPRQVYKFATPICQPSCTKRNPKCKELIEGCVCRKGYLLSGKTCVRKSKCGCFYKGFYMEANEDIIDPKCQRKTICKAGGKVVTETLAPCQPKGICRLQKGKRICVCKRGFYFHNGKCTPKVCEKTVADIVFLLDESGSVTRKNFVKVKQFVIDVVRSLKIGSTRVRVGVVSFSSKTTIRFHLKRYFDQKRMINAIRNIRYGGGVTNTHTALTRLRLSAFTKRYGDRVGVPNIAIVITDGKSSNARATKIAASRLQKAGVIMFSIGIGKNLRQSELRAMASKPISEHKFTVDSFAALKNIANEITTKTCEDSCISKGCRNGGICTRIAKRGKCICKAGFFGKYCQHQKACYCSGYGDPHYKTFDGQMIHFMGICKYTLAASTKGAPYFFAVEVKNEHRGNTRVSYTRMVDVKLKGVTIRLLPGNKMLVNGEKRSFPIRGVWGFWARYSCGWITVSTSWGLKVQFDGRHRVKVTVRGRFANKLTGICGDCNGKKDDFRTKQGKDVSKYRKKYSLIGNSYKVKDDSDKPTTKCDVPDVKIDCKPHETRSCNLIKHRIFKKCRAKLGMKKVGEYLESCRIDACVYRKNIKLLQKVLCSAIEGYAGECAKAGVPVAWRRVAKCPQRCPPRQVYKFATPICQPSCTKRNPKCKELIEGCVCRRGYLLSGKKCVPKSKCGCFYKGFYMEANGDIIDPKCQKKTICKAGGKVVTETLAPCQPNGICKLQKGKRICVCKRGFYFHNGKCTPKVCEKTVADIVFLLDESGSVTRKNFVKVKQFVIDVVRSLKIGSTRVRVGVVSFSSKTTIRFHLKRYFDQKRMINAIRNIRYGGGVTNTHTALTRLRLSAFTKRYGDRVGVPNIAIVITDGKSSNARATKIAASRLQKAGVIMFSIGIGKNLRQSELRAMASKPISEHKFTVDSFAALKNIANEITTKTCEDSCISKGCRNGGICTRIAKRGKCICKAGFFGKYCQHQKACYCSGYGDPHYKTFDGQMIHFMGICKYTLAASTKGAPYFFAVEVKNEHRGNTRVSYTRMVDVKLKGVTIRLLPGNKMLVNGEKRSFPIRGVWGFWARYSCGWITVSTSWGLKVQFDGRHRVKVTVRGRFANKLTGICGDCNGKKDDFRTKQGKDVSKYRKKYSLIGNSYKVKDDSDKPTTKCDVPDVKIDCKPHETRSCNLIKHRIFKKCRAKLGMKKVGEYLESCRIDACVYRKNIKLFKKVLCSAIEGYAGECAKAGVPVAWRRVAKCPQRCPPRQVYKFATPICQPSCTKRNPKCKELIEGCVCRRGYLLSGKKCVPKSKCGCFYKGFYMEANGDIIDPKCQRKTICKAGGKLVTETLAPCQPNGICKLQKGKRICVCKRGFYFHNGKCTPKVCEKTVADIVFLLDESGSVTRKNFVKVKQFVIDVVRSLKIGSNRVRVGVVSFSSKTSIRFHLKRYFDQKRMINAIRNIRYGGGGTNTHIALTRLRLSAFTKRYGDRVGVPNIAIVITDGKSSKARATKIAASRLQKAGVIMFSIGIGKKLRQSELIAMASKPISEHKFTVDSFAALKNIANEITTKTCEEIINKLEKH